jgi:hypothetical protein
VEQIQKSVSLTEKIAGQECNPQTAPQTEGVVMRGADGTLYFIPNRILKTYTVPEPAVAVLAAKLPDGEMTADASISTEWMHSVGACIMLHG